MSVSFPSSQYKFSGQRYDFKAEIYVDGDRDNTLLQLDQRQIREFSYINALGDLCLTGQLDYTDLTGHLVNFLNEQSVALTVTHTPLYEMFDNSFAVQIPVKEAAFAHTFMVTGMQITGRNGSAISYSIQLVSVLWFDCIKTIDFTNYGKDKQPVTEIIRTCMQQAGLPVDSDAFVLSKSAVSINYITNGNDNLFTVLKYLMNKTYYYKDRDDTMRFVCYDDIVGMYGLFDMSFPRGPRKNGMNRITVSMDKSAIEQLTSADQAQLASVIRMPKTKVFKSLFTRDVSAFDYSANAFTADQIGTDAIAGLYNSHGGFKNADVKMVGMPDANGEYVYRSSIWNSQTDIYGEQLRNLFEDNSLVVNVVGWTTRQPGDTIELVVSKDRSDCKTDSQSEYQDWLARYRELEGAWFVAKVRHMICPAGDGTAYYKQNLVLFKNFIDAK